MPSPPTTYHLPPTRLVPNSPDPLLHYPAFFPPPPSSSELPPSALASIHEQFSSNAWHPQWIFRYGRTQSAHYHSRTHECMVVLSGSARIRFGRADAESSTEDYSSEKRELDSEEEEEEGEGVEVDARVGDVFVLPAGVAHKTFAPQPETEFALLTPGEAKGVTREEVAATQLAGFTMMGAYPRGSESWDFQVGGEDVGQFEKVWAVSRPEKDPVLGAAREGLLGLWKE